MPFSAALVRCGVLAWAICSALMAAAALAGAFFAPLDVINQIAPAWVFIALAGIAASRFGLPAGRTRQITMAAFGAAAFTHAAFVAPEVVRRSPAPEAPSAGAPRIRIVWLNTQSGTAGESVTDYLLSTDADFVMLAEFHAEAGMVTPALEAAYPHLVQCAEPHACNVAILSRRRPFDARPSHEVSPNELRVVWADYDIDGAPIRLVATHLQRPYPAARHAAQRTELADVVGGAAHDNTVLAGDFNAAPWSFALKAFDRAGGLDRFTRATPTWPAEPWTRLRLPAPAPFMPIDHVYAGDNWQLVWVRRGPRAGADHYPIEAEFIWVGAGGG